MRTISFVAMTLWMMACATNAAAQARVEKNVVYGMYSGLALLMDVHLPPVSNGRGIVVIPGSAFSRPLGYDAPQLKDAPFVQDFVATLGQAGYTVFPPSHRATPRFQYPSAVEDVQRAIRFIRANAVKYGSTRLGWVPSGGPQGATWSACSAHWMEGVIGQTRILSTA
ncbi:hypothetical protein LuPra_02027 [Luteitalea pratensis]|uniref:BD-FAE-like domain-containing protein n=1 Tax=Luteitalea pratensis TaxID=1855912 RepID=A0A143PK02_LUTPR|nr:hypothetical protein [Luteitalea pratensis]AMY08821.1 hypothetical protein LuPra_02027 [Luteitalea pratensis]